MPKDIEFTHNGERACAYILIRNKSEYEIQGCCLKAKTNSIEDLTALAWSENNPEPYLEYKNTSLRPEDVLRADVAVAWKKEDHAVLCIFPRSDNDRILHPGETVLSIHAYGKINAQFVEHEEIFTISYEGGNEISFMRSSQR
jgi:hypothetical protein